MAISAKRLLSKSPWTYFHAKLLLFRVHRLVAFVVPDEPFVRIQYWWRRRRWLNLRNPTLYNEKIQWLKLHYRDPLLRICVDKWEVREYVRRKGLGRILVPCGGVFDDAQQIDWNALPSEFILKLTNGSSFNEICSNGSTFNRAEVSKRFEHWKSLDFYSARREWAYKDVPNRIICEHLLRSESGGLPSDYRFFCFHGKVKVIAVDLDSVVEGKKTSNYFRHLFDRDWQEIDARIQYPRKPGSFVPRPKALDEMIDVAETLAEDFPAARVDLYEVSGRIYFGEITFYHASGYQEIVPREFEELMGSWIDLGTIKGGKYVNVEPACVDEARPSQ